MQKNRLFDLIKSLDKNEKGYLKKHLFDKTNSESRYFIILFDAMLEQTTYDESALKLKIGNRNILRHFSSHKTYLYEAIMKLLIAYQSQNTVKNQIKTQIRTAEILFQKGLHEDGNYALSKAMKLAKKNDFFSFMLEIHDLFHRNNIAFMDYKSLASIEQNHRHMLGDFKRYGNLLEYRSIQIESLKILRAKASIDKQKKLITLAQSTLLNNAKNVLSLSAEIMHNNCNGMLYLELHQPAKALEFFKKLIGVVEKSGWADSQEFIVNYIVILGNAMITANMVGNKIVFGLALNKMNRLLINHKKYELTITRNVIKTKLFYYIRHSLLNEGLSYVATIEKKIDSLFPSYDHSKQFINNEVAILYFMAGDYKNATQYLKHTLLHKQVKSADPELVCFAYVLWLLAEYLLGDYDFVDHLLRSMERKIKSLRYDSFIASQCIHFVKTVNHQTDPVLLRGAYNKLIQSVKQRPHFNFNESYVFSIADWAAKRRKEILPGSGLK